MPLSRVVALVLAVAPLCGCAATDRVSCATPTECVVTGPECCWGAHDDHAWIAVRRDRAGDGWDADGCESPEPSTPFCIVFCGQQTFYPIATCERGTCVGLVPEAQPWTECTVDADCVALPRDCTDCRPFGACESRAHYAGVARAHEREYTLLLCGPERELPPCDASRAVARCVAGHCQLAGF